MLDGSVHPIDRRGNPAAAHAKALLAEMAATENGREDQVISALVLQAQALAAGGDFVQALEISERILATEAGTVDERAILTLGKRFWWFARHISNSGAFYRSQDFQMRYPSWKNEVSPASRSWSSDTLRMTLLFENLFFYSLVPSSLQMTQDDSELMDRVFRLSSGIQKKFCIEHEQFRDNLYCALAESLVARLQIFAGESQQTVLRIRNALKGVDRRTLELSAAELSHVKGLMLMSLGDALVAPNSEPLELNLWALGSTHTLLDLGAFQQARELKMVSEAQQMEAMQSYEMARRAFEQASCTRCLADLLVRDAYLDYCRESFRASREGFLRAMEQYSKLGDLREAYRAYFAAVAVSTHRSLLGSEEPRKSNLLMADRDLLPQRWGLLISSARLFARMGILHQQQLEVQSALNVFDLAMDAAESAHADFLLGEIARDKANLLRGIGRYEEAAFLLDFQLKAIRKYRRVQESVLRPKGDKNEWSLPEKEENLGTEKSLLIQELSILTANLQLALMRDQRESVYSLIPQMRAFVAENRVALESVDPDVLVGSYEAAFHLRSGRVEKALKVAQEKGDVGSIVLSYLFKRKFLRAGQIALAEAEDALTQLEIAWKKETTSWGSKLTIQELRSKICVHLENLTGSKMYEAALRIWERTDRLWWDRFPEAEGRRGLFWEQGRRWGAFRLWAEIHQGLGQAAYQRGNRDISNQHFGMARESFREALRTIEKVGSQTGNLIDRSSFLNDVAVAFGAYTRFLTLQGVLEQDQDQLLKALGVLESSRAEIFHTLLLEAAPGTEGSKLQRWWRVRSELEAARTSLADLTIRGQGDNREGRAARERLAALMANEEQWVEQLPHLAEVGLRSEEQDQEILKDLRSLPAELAKAEAPTTLLAYFVHGGHAAVWVLDDQGMTFHELDEGKKNPDSNHEIYEDVATLVSKLDAQEEAWEEPARRLYELLIAPIEGLLPITEDPAKRARIGIVPHGGLAKVPFHVLLRAEAGKDRLLIEDYDLFYLPSLRYLTTRQESFASQGGLDFSRFLAFGYDGTNKRLTAAENEVERIADRVGVTPVVGATATAERFHRESDQASILHLAAHTIQSRVNPFLIAFDLHGEPLHVYDLAGKNWPQMALVTLSGCETGGGRWNKNDEVTGLARMFLTAGAQTVVASQWLVDDEATVRLMERFYKNLQRGQEPLSALMNAQRRLYRMGYPPALWAGFSLHGHA